MDTMDVNEITKVIDGVYKNITDNFNPASKQMIATGKAYLKSLHGASAACSMYLEALSKLSKQAQQSSVGTSVDIGSSMMQIADVFKEIHTQQLTTLKAFYVDFLVPLETNLEKDVKVIQNEQKKFLVSHKHRVESYNKAVSNAKKVRKKSKKSSQPSSSTLDKEIRIMQAMEEERSKLEAFCEEALREALTQERRRYGFVLERQASMAKHYLAFYSKGGQSLGSKLDQWLKVSKSREALPENMQTNLVKKIQQQGEEECIYCSPRRPADDTASISSQLRKTKSMGADEMLNIQNSTSSNSSSGGNYHLTSASSRGGIGGGGHLHAHQQHHQCHQDLPITSAGALSRAKSDTSLGMINGGSGGGGIYGTTGLALVNDHHLPSNMQQNQAPPLPPPDNFRSSKSMAALSSVGQSAGNGSTSSNQMEPGHVGYAKALYAYLSNGDNQLSFLEGEVIALIGERNRGWQFGENLRTQKMGWFPVAYTEILEQLQNKSASDLMMISKHHAGASPVPPPMPPPLPSANNMPRTPEHNAGNRKGVQQGKPAGVKNLMIPSNMTNDSLHSSNDSGFDNDIHHPSHHGHLGPVPPPPQPEIDYSDEEPQHLNRSDQEIKSGNKWLMDRYHMSETARITSSTRRRSLSSGNLSTSDREQPDSLQSSMMIRNNNLRNSTAFVHNGAGNSPRGAHHQLATANTFYDESKEGGGALKKFLSRTKSLIWRRPSNAGDNQQYNGQNGNGHDSIRMQRPQQALESISCADTTSELWGSHSSIVEMTEFEMKDMSPTSTIKKEMMTMTDNSEDNGPTQENDYYANGNIIKTKQARSRGEKTGSGEPVPTLPPRNDQTRGGAQTSSNKMQHSPGSSSTNSNISIPKEADNSCLVVSDHTRSVKKSSSKNAEYGEPSYQTARTSGRSQKENDIDSIQKQSHRGKRSTRGEKSNVSRVESFAVSEAPIIPESKFSRRSITNGSVALSNKTSRSRGTTITNGNQSGMNEGAGSGVVESRGRRRIWEDHAINDDDDYNSELEKDIDEEEEDEGTIDFNDNDEYDEEEAASSVFMEGEIEQEQQEQQQITNGKMSMSSSTKMERRPPPAKEPKNQCSAPASSAGGTKRSKSSDVTTRTDNSRRSRSSSTKTHGMDTVDMPKRHGGFIREKVSRSATVATGLESVASRSTSKSQSRSHGTAMRSASSPAQRNDSQGPPPPPKEKQKVKSNAQGSKHHHQSKKIPAGPPAPGPMYKGRPIGSPPPIPAPLPQQHQQKPSQPPPPPPPPHQSQNQSLNSLPPKQFADASTEANGNLTEAEPDYGTIKGSSPSPSRKDLPSELLPQQKHQLITMKQTIVPYGKHQSLIIRDTEGRKAAPRAGSAWKGSIRSEIHTVELITTADVQGAGAVSVSSSGGKPVYDYGSYIRRRLYFPERASRLDQKSERGGNYCGPWYDLWGEDPSVSVG